jgi:hypothetical protein
MKPSEIGFFPSSQELRWEDRGVVHVIPTLNRRTVHSYCQVCVLALDEPDPCVVAVVSWHSSEIIALPSWDLASDMLAQQSKPSEEIPEAAVQFLTKLRDARAVYEWISRAGGRHPPLRFWLAALAAHWAGDQEAAIAEIGRYRSSVLGSDLQHRADRIKELIEKKSGNQ